MNKEWCGLLNVWWCQSDEDMTHMHMTMIGSCISERGVQQGCPSHKGGPRLIQFESPRWRPKTTQVRVHLGVQEQPTMFWSPRPHTESVFDVLHMDGKLRRHTFQCRWSHAKILSESTGIIETMDTQNLPGRCAAVFWAVGPCIMLQPIGARPGGRPRPNPYIFSSRRHIRV